MRLLAPLDLQRSSRSIFVQSFYGFLHAYQKLSRLLRNMRHNFGVFLQVLPLAMKNLCLSFSTTTETRLLTKSKGTSSIFWNICNVQFLGA